jgi:hypothetical protein
MLLAILGGESDGEGVLLSPGFIVGETSSLAPAAVGRDAHTNPSVGRST